MWFDEWLEQNVYTFHGRLKRKQCIKRFTKALWHFIINRGYSWQITEYHLQNCIATGLYENTGKSHIASEWNYSDVNTEYSDDDLNHYLHIVDSYAWATFWAQNGLWGDLDKDEFRGQDRRQDIEEFVWKQINILASPQTQELYEILLGGEDDVPLTPAGEVYLQETVEYNGWGGIRR
jgi:hypothetical protein